MDSPTQGILLVGGLLILLVLGIDAIRRYRRSQSTALRLSKNLGENVQRDVLEDYGNEFPNGGARSIPTDDEVAVETVSEASVAEQPEDLSDERFLEVIEEGEDNDDDDDETSSAAQPTVETAEQIADELESAIPILTDEIIASERPSVSEEPAPHSSASSDTLQPGHNLEITDTMLTVLVKSANGQLFNGHDIVEALISNGVLYGAKQIFHNHRNQNVKNDVEFSVANLMEPGYFDLESLDEFTTSGLVFFMTLPRTNPDVALKSMIRVAKNITERLDGVLYDETHSAFTQQTLLHYQTRIQDFERDRLCQSAKAE